MALPALTDSAQVLTLLFGGGLIGSLLTLGIQHRLARSARRADLMLEAYTSYLMAVARASYVRGEEEYVASRRDLVFAKLRVLAIGSPRVVDALRSLEERSHELATAGFAGNFSKDSAWSSRLVAVVHAIRTDLSPSAQVSIDAIHSIILDPR